MAVSSDLEGFRRRLRRCMADAGMRFDTDLSRATGISPNTIGNIWKPARKDLPTADQAVAIARAAHTTVEYLVTGGTPPGSADDPDVIEFQELLAPLTFQQRRGLMDIVHAYVAALGRPARDQGAAAE